MRRISLLICNLLVVVKVSVIISKFYLPFFEDCACGNNLYLRRLDS